MIKIGVNIKETKVDDKSHIEVKVVLPKEVKTATDSEKSTAKFVVEALNEAFGKNTDKKEED